VRRQRDQFGKMNAGLEETNLRHRGRQGQRAGSLRAAQVPRLGPPLPRLLSSSRATWKRATLPVLLFGIAYGLCFLHAMTLYQNGQIQIADIVAYMGIIGVLRWPTFATIFTISLVAGGRGRRAAHPAHPPGRNRSG
jgi:ATP-binding cassette subfamily B protein